MEDSNCNSLPMNSPSPSMFANAMFPLTVFGSKCCDKEGMKESKKEALNSVMDIFQAYWLSPKLITRQAMCVIKEVRKIREGFAFGVHDMRYTPDRKSKLQAIYCSKCWHVDELGQKLYMCPIAEVKFDEGECAESNKKMGGVQVCAVYPHNANCTTKDKDFLNKNRIDPSLYGRGWEVYSFPSELIFKDNFRPFLEHLSTLNSRKRNHHG